MKKITLFIALLCSISAFSARYLIQLGNGSVGAATWTATSGGTVVNLATVGAGSTSKSLNEWYADKLLTTPTFSGSPALVSGDEVWLAAGTYVTTATMSFRSGVSLYGGFAGTELAIADRSKVSEGKIWEFTTPTIIDGNNASRQGIITATSTPITYIDGLTITKYNITAAAGNIAGVGAMVMTNWIMQNCIVSYNTFTNSTDKQCRGAGVYIQGGQLLNSYMHHNSATKGIGTGNTYGGGVAFVYNTSPATTVKGCTIESNVSTVVGGGMANLDGTGGVIEDCIFQSNSCPSGNGGAIGTSASTSTGNGLTLKNNQFIENTAGGNGGGIYYYLSASVVTSIEGCSFIGNVSTAGLNGGGGLCLDLGNFPVVKNCIFRDNKNTSANHGSAIFLGPANTTVQNCVFANNSNLSINTHIIKVTGANSKFLNCTFANNLTSGTGSAISFENTVSTLSNCIFWNNYRFLNVSTMVYRDVYGYTNTTSTYNATDGGDIWGISRVGDIKTLNSTVNNTFVSPTTFQGAPVDETQKAASAAADWSLKFGCPAINTGTDLAASGVTTDILGNTRPTGAGAVDRGAYEYGFTTAQTITFGALSAKTYGDGTSTLSASGGGSGNPVVFTSSNTSVVTCTGTNGTTLTVVGAGICTIYANQASSVPYSAAIQVGQSLTVNPKPLTGISSASATSKVYNASSTAVITGTFTGIIGSDAVNLTGTFNTASVGNTKAVTTTSTLGGAKAANYTFTGIVPIGLAANITPKALTMSGLSVPASKTYNGTTAAVVTDAKTLLSTEAAGTGTTNDGKPYTGDAVSITGTPVGTYNSKDVASASTVTYSGLSLTGAQAGNYTLTIQGTSSATITPIPLTITGLLGVNKEYDGSNTGTLNGTAEYSGLVNSEIFIVTGTPSANFADATVGNGKSITVTGYTAPSGNYTVSQPTGITANISAATSSIEGGDISTAGLSDEQLANTDITVSSGEMVINVGKTVRSITVNAGAKLSVSYGQTLTLTNLTLKSDAFNGTSTFVNDGTLAVSGSTKVEQYLASTRNWYVSSPVSNANAPAGYTYYKRNEAGSSWTPISEGSGLTAGVGYIALPGTSGLPITFTTQSGGTINSGSVTIPITYTPLATSAKGYNLIGNPYPSHLTWTKTFVDNNASLIEPSIYYRTNAGSVNSGGDAAWSFKTYNSSTNEFSPAGTTNIIPPMQAFWIRAKASGNLILNSDLTKSHQTSNPLKVPAMYNSERQRVRLQVTNGTRTDETLLLFDSNAADGYDMFDSPKFADANSEVQIYTIVGTEKLVMNGMNSIPLNQEIALGFVQGSATSFNIKANEICNLPSNVRVILKDNVTKAETDLTDGVSIYQFTTEAFTNERFSLVFRTPVVITEINNTENGIVQVFVNAANQITIIAPEKSNYAIYNAMGQQIENGILNTKLETRNAKFGAGVYFVAITVNAQNKIEKVIIR